MDIFEAVAEMRVEELNSKFVRNLLKGTEFSMDKIASLVGVSVDFVKEVKKTVKKKEITHNKYLFLKPPGDPGGFLILVRNRT